MQSKALVDDGSEDLFHLRLLAMIYLRHELVKLAKALDWATTDATPATSASHFVEDRHAETLKELECDKP